MTSVLASRFGIHQHITGQKMAAEDYTLVKGHSTKGY